MSDPRFEKDDRDADLFEVGCCISASAPTWTDIAEAGAVRICVRHPHDQQTRGRQDRDAYMARVNEVRAEQGLPPLRRI